MFGRIVNIGTTWFEIAWYTWKPNGVTIVDRVMFWMAYPAKTNEDVAWCFAAYEY
jgi:hypothetical protein